jgi:hypothetical protein
MQLPGSEHSIKGKQGSLMALRSHQGPCHKAVQVLSGGGRLLANSMP